MESRFAPQGLPPLFAAAPRRLVAHKTVAEFPKNTFLENLAVNARGTLFLTSYEDGVIYRMRPGEKPGRFARVGGNAAGIALLRDGGLLVSGRGPDRAARVWRISRAGRTETLLDVAGGQFLNGIASLGGDRYLVADSYRGVVYAVDARARQARVWLEDPLFARSSGKNPFPGVNGLKVFRDALYASNTERRLLLRIPLDGGGKAGVPRVFVRNVNLDDFAFDRVGNLYATTHVYNSLVRVSRKGEVTIVAEGAQGMTGSTAAAFGRSGADRTSLYVVTNGGMSLPPAGGVEPGKVVRLEIGVRGG